MNSGVQPEAQGEQAPAGGLAFGDILFTLFRHKILILSFLLLGLIGAVVVRFVKPPNYESTAQIYVPYVIDLTAVNPADPNTPITKTGVGGDMVMNTEVEMLKSFDTALDVVDKIGAEKILEKYGGGSNRLGAAGVVASGIYVNPPRTMSLTVTFSHRDSELVQPVMAAIVKAYMRRHSEIHVKAGDEMMLERREEARKKLAQIEVEIKKLKTDAGVPDLRERLSLITKEHSTLQSHVIKSQIELASRKAKLGEFASLTNSPASMVPPDTIRSYSDVMGQIEEIKKRQRTLLLDDYTTNHPVFVKLEVKMQDQLKQRLNLEKQFPALTNYISSGSNPRNGSDGGTNNSKFDLESEWASINQLARTVKSDETVLISLRDEAFLIMELEPKLTELERRRDAAKKDYEYILTNLEKSSWDENAAGQVVNMRETQSPTPPKLDQKKLMKLVGAVLGGFIGLGVGIAFLIDMFLDRSIRRASQIVRGLRLPVVLTIPDSNRKNSSLFSWGRHNQNLKVMRPDKNTDAANGANAIAPWSPDNQLQSHIEGLRERVITHFEVREQNHNPKLVAVTSCGDGAGVTTLASGLAAALSRTGNGTALLVDMNSGEGVTHSFYKGKPGYGPSESIEDDAETELAGKNLSLTKTSGGKTKRDRLDGMLPPSFGHLKPKLNANAYDYVVFDMTAISPASVTPRLSGHMDLVLFVIEAEKTKDHVARSACGLLRESRANVLAILNKYHNPVPSWLAHD